jgi:nucleotide-binding universal stress UspA family protein
MKTYTRSRNGARHLRIKNILVPIDFSPMSVKAIATAKRLAERFDATVHLAHAQEYSYSTIIAPVAPVLVAPMNDFENWRAMAEQQLVRLAKEHGLSGTARAEIGGAPFDTLCWIASDIRADLIVTSTHGRTGMKRVFLGSTAERLVQHAPCPVYIDRKRNRRHQRQSIDNILVPVDFSDCSLGGLDYAIRFAKKFAARVLVLHVVDLGLLLTADGYAMYDMSAVEEAVIKRAEQQMREFVRRAKFNGVPHQTMIVAGGSVGAICRIAETEDVDLIVTATHGRSGLPHLLIGSTAELTVRHAPRPVLVVPSHPEIRARNAAERETRKSRTTTPPRKVVRDAIATRRSRRTTAHPFPERRKTNKFRETHLVGLR